MKKTVCFLVTVILVLAMLCGCTNDFTETSSLEPLTQEQAAGLLVQSYYEYLDDSEFHCVEPDVEFVREKTVKDHDCYLFYLFDLREGSDKGLTHLLVDKNTSEVFVAGASGDDLVPIQQYR